MRYVNLFGKDVTIVDTDGVITKRFNALGCAYVMPGKHRTENSPVYHGRFFSVIGLPEESDDVLYIVTRDVRMAAPERDDLVTPAFPVWENSSVAGFLSLLHEH